MIPLYSYIGFTLFFIVSLFKLITVINNDLKTSNTHSCYLQRLKTILAVVYILFKPIDNLIIYNS